MESMDHRAIVEVLKWSEPRHLLQAAAWVSVRWSRATEDETVWQFFLGRLGLSSTASAKIELKGRVHLAGRSLVAMSAECLGVFDCESLTVTTSVRIDTRPIDQYAAVVCLMDCSVFACGGAGAETASFRLPLPGLHITDVREMLHSRCFHAAVLANFCIYAFGGVFSKSAKTAEKYSLWTREWKPLPNMQSGRSCFTAAKHRTSVYLCGGNVIECESFNIVSESYMPLHYRLTEASWCVAGYDEELVVLVRGGFCYPERRAWKPGPLAILP